MAKCEYRIFTHWIRGEKCGFKLDKDGKCQIHGTDTKGKDS